MHTAKIAETGLPGRVISSSIAVLDTRGEPLPNTDVVVEQTAHAFRFGNIGFELLDLAVGEPTEGDELLAERWLALFNTATLPFYWGRFEATRGEPQTDRMRSATQWFVDRGVELKGHPLAWHTLSPPWLLGLTLVEIEEALRGRIRRDVSDFAGLVDT